MRWCLKLFLFFSFPPPSLSSAPNYEYGQRTPTIDLQRRCTVWLAFIIHRSRLAATLLRSQPQISILRRIVHRIPSISSAQHLGPIVLERFLLIPRFRSDKRGLKAISSDSSQRLHSSIRKVRRIRSFAHLATIVVRQSPPLSFALSSARQTTSSLNRSPPIAALWPDKQSKRSTCRE